MSCNGICDTINNSYLGYPKYSKGYRYCSKCTLSIKTSNNFCPCCNSMLRKKSRTCP